MAYTHSFADPIWYNIAVYFKKDELVFRINCEEEHRAFISGDILKNFDVYGQMYLGADKEEEKEKAFVRVSEIEIVFSLRGIFAINNKYYFKTFQIAATRSQF